MRRAMASFAAIALALPGFAGTSEPISPHLRERMTGVSWHRGCPVGFGQLRLLRVSHWGFDGESHRGRLVVHRDSAQPILRTMLQLYRLHFPIRRMRLVDAYGAADHRSMAADNTSAFNCRFVAGTGRWSEHAYGHAIDVNPVENPYVTADGYVNPWIPFFELAEGEQRTGVDAAMKRYRSISGSITCDRCDEPEVGENLYVLFDRNVGTRAEPAPRPA